MFTTRRAAWEHFGDDGCTSDMPACIDPLRADEKARMTELREARKLVLRYQHEAEEAQGDVDLLASYRVELGRLFGTCGGTTVSTPHQAWLVMDSVKGEVLMWKGRAEKAEQLLAALPRMLS